MKAKFTALGFVLGVLTTTAGFHFLGDDIKVELAQIEKFVGETVHSIGKQLSRAGKGMLN
jgi:hypothetical protein